MSAELLLAVPPTIDLCLKYIKEGRDLCSTLKHANTEVSERCVRLDNNWIRFLSQLNFFQRTYPVMEDEQREVYSQTLDILQNKLGIVVSLLRDLVKPQPGSEEQTSLSTYKVRRWKYAGKKSSLDEAIEDLEKWQGVADQSWFLLLRIANSQVDQALAICGSSNEPRSGTVMKTMKTIRAGLQHTADSNHGVSTAEHVTLSSSDLRSMTTQAIPFCEGIAVATRTHSNGSVSRYILNHIQCEPGAKPQILKRNVRDLVQKLQADDPNTFGLLKCKGFVAELVSAGLIQNLSITLVFRNPPASHDLKSLRDILLHTPASTSITRRLEIARDLAKSVSYVHTFGFVHKNIRPESIIIFNRDNRQSRAALVGFENFRRDEGWTQRRGDDMPDKNLYRHPSRQGFNPRDDYEMRHDIYSLGVCLLEVGLWRSLVDYNRVTGARTLSQLLSGPSLERKESVLPHSGDQIKDCFISLVRCRLPGSMGDRYAEIVETCLTCLDPGNVDFGDEKAFEDENGILVGARYIEKKPANDDTDSCSNAELKTNYNSAAGCQDDCCENQAGDVPDEDSHCSSNTDKVDSIKATKCCGDKPSPTVDTLAPGQDSCCSRLRRPSLERPSGSCVSVVSSVSADSCCAPKAKEAGASIKKSSCTETCCSDEKPPQGTDTCCESKEPGADTCCMDTKTGILQDIKEVQSTTARVDDLEKGLAAKEHVILSISGMTCTGCETKLSRTLATLPSITKLKTSLVLSRAEFDLDTHTQSVAEIIKHLERTTEFKCERITNQGSSLDLICTGDSTDIVKGDWPNGVIEVRVVDKRTIRVDFDAKVIGARDLVEKGWPTPMSLASPSADPTLDAGARHVRHVGYMTLLSILLTIPVLVLAWAPLPNKDQKEITFGSISLAFATVIQVVVAGPFYPKALKALIFSRVIEMDLLIVLSTSAAYIFSVVAFGYLVHHKPLSTGEFFETSTLLVTLIMVGRFIAALARQKAVESISIRSLQTSSATLVRSGIDDADEVIDARLLQYGDVFRVSPDSRIPTDGTVISGVSEIDESMLTGESRPVEKSKGSSVIAGSINGSGVLTVRLTRVPGDNTISTIASMVDEAKLSKPKIQEIADRVAAYFVPVVISITVIVFCIWMAVGTAVQKKPASEATVQAITYAITVLIVSCPCAIGLAVPMVIVVSTGVAAERGVIFKSADAIETAWKTAHVVFDKTGTLTQGRLTISQEEYLNSSASTKALLLGLISSSKHPVSAAVANYLKAEGVAATTVSDPKHLVGKGIEGAFAGRSLRAGNSRWLGLSENTAVQAMLSPGLTAFCFTIDGELAAVFGLKDSLRDDTLQTITQLQKDGITVHVLSGDDEGAVLAVTTQLGIPASNVRSRCTPTEKRDYINELFAAPDSRRSKKPSEKPVVMFCGDGTNDAVALAQASIGVHMNEGTDVAKSAADVVLMRPSIAGVLTAIKVSRKSTHRIWFNFGWSFVYNTFAILLAAGAFVHARIPPEFAGLGELVSVLPVVAAGMLLKWTKI
ncbi:P-type cation-transporting [Curvularia clavata]|uniref:P-type cation-transporting n=1 Tax=Curvularia clavata TaxID=95742 RepID=A0A9Q8ZFJ8_CURCL|nr:P-type cation-transporting [Curvularia clavata]